MTARNIAGWSVPVCSVPDLPGRCSCMDTTRSPPWSSITLSVTAHSFRGANPETHHYFTSAGANRRECTSPHGSPRPETLRRSLPNFRHFGAARSCQFLPDSHALSAACFNAWSRSLLRLPRFFAIATRAPMPAKAPTSFATCPVLRNGQYLPRLTPIAPVATLTGASPVFSGPTLHSGSLTST